MKKEARIAAGAEVYRNADLSLAEKHRKMSELVQGLSHFEQAAFATLAFIYWMKGKK